MLDPTNVYGVYLLFISSQRKTSKCLKKIQKNFQLTEKTKSKIAKMKFIFLLIYYIRGTVNGQGSSYRKLFESLIVSQSHSSRIGICNDAQRKIKYLKKDLNETSNRHRAGAHDIDM